MEYQFIWHDGGRAAAGFTGYTSDCAARAIAIGTGKAYQEVYDAITSQQGVSPRTGTFCAATLLEKWGWKQAACTSMDALPTDKSVLILSMVGKRSGHLAAMVGKTLYDTWDCLAASNHQLERFWWHPKIAKANSNGLPKVSVGCRDRVRHDGEFQKVLTRIRKLDATASNAAATEGEVRNALRAIQAMLFKHNLTMDEVAESNDMVAEGLTNQRVTVNGKNACNWESNLVRYVVDEVFPLVFHYRSRVDKRTFYWFYGPVDDVVQCMELFRELLLTIATIAKTHYGTFRRGSGASYAEGFVDGLPRSSVKQEEVTPTPDELRLCDSQLNDTLSEGSQAGVLLVKERAKQMRIMTTNWLSEECGIKLHRRSYGSGRYAFDRQAHDKGKRDGSKHDVGNQPKRITG